MEKAVKSYDCCSEDLGLNVVKTEMKTLKGRGKPTFR